jgi:hypothetical protein
MSIFALFLGGLMVAAANPSASPAPAQSSAATAAAPADPLSGKICRRFETTGSILRSKRVCMTAEKWREHDARVAEDNRQRKDSFFGTSRCNKGAAAAAC